MSSSHSYEDGVAAVIELIGEMAWGVDLPGVPFSFMDTGTNERVIINLNPTSTKPIFEAIYQKLKLSPDYRPYSSAAARASHAEFYLDAALTIIEDLLSDDDSSTAILAGHLLNQCGRGER
jgi:hypothetical protein